MAGLAQALADSPRTILQTLAETILVVLDVGSAGVSLLTDDGQRFYWPAIAGAWQPHIGGGTPRDSGPCGDVLNANASLLFKHPERRYDYFLATSPAVEEALLVPFYIEGKAVGTIWAIAHDDRRTFDAEDLRQLESLGRFASAAYQVTKSLDTAFEQRHAAHSLMNEAVRSRQTAEALNAELRASEEALHESEERFRAAIGIVSSLIWTNNAQGLMEGDQPGWSNFTGQTFEEYQGYGWTKAVHPEDAPLTIAAWERAVADKTLFEFEHRIRRRDGAWRLCSIRAVPLLRDDGAIREWVGVHTDITESKRVETNLALLASVSQDLVRLTNMDDMIQTVGAKIGAYLNLSLCVFAEINETADEVSVLHDWHRDDVPGVVGVYRVADFASEDFVRAARTGETIVVRDAATDPLTIAKTFAPLSIASFICVPLVRDGQWHAVLSLNRSVASDWREDEIELTRELTTRIWTRLERLRSEEALHKSEERFRALATASSDVIYRMNADWSEMHQLQGRNFIVDTEKPSGSWLQEYIPPADQPRVLAVIGEAIRTKTVFQLEHQVRRADGDLGWTFSRAVPLLDAQGDILEWFGAASDVTERKQTADALRASEERYRYLFNSIDEGFCVIELIFDEHQTPVDYRFLEVNPSFEQQTGLHAAVGKRMREFVPDFEASWFQRYGEVARTGEPVRFTNESKDLQRWFDVYAFRIGGPDSRSVAVLFNNITERTKAEDALRASALALADLDRRKDEFLAMLSHELRNPLAPIVNAVQLLRLQKDENPLQQQARTIIERQVGQLNHLVDDLLEVSRVTTGRIQLRRNRIGVSGIVERAVETTRPLVEQRRHQLTVSLPPQPIWLDADAARLEQVVVNLLTNAAKYTDEGGHIWLTVEQEGDAAVLRVRDTGPGIAPEILPRIFDLFTQAERSLDRSQGGLGIGLSLVQRLVDLHGGTVDVYSALGHGSEFVVRLPIMLTALPSSTPPSTDPAPPPGTGCRVLVVDDNRDAAAMLATLLEASGHEVRMAHDGQTALKTTIDDRPDVVLLDIGLPVLDGFEVAKRIRQQPGLEHVVLVAVTGYGQESDRERSRDAGFDHHLVKPADFGKVREILAAAAEKGLVRE